MSCIIISMRISKFELSKFHPIFLSAVLQTLFCSFYCFGDMKELKGNNTHVLKSYLNELKFNIGPYMKT